MFFIYYEMNIFEKNIDYLRLGSYYETFYSFLPEKYEATLQEVKTNIKFPSGENVTLLNLKITLK